MYKYKLMTKCRKTGNESTIESNKLQRLIADANACHQVSFIIIRNHNGQLMMKGAK